MIFMFQQCKMKYVQKIARPLVALTKSETCFLHQCLFNAMRVILLELVLTYNEIRIVYELTCLLTAQVLISVQLIRFVLGCLYFLQIACNLIKYKVHKI